MSKIPEQPEASSGYLLAVLDGRDVEDDPLHAAAVREAARRVRAITGLVLDSRRKLVDLPIDSLDELIAFDSAGKLLLDDYYCHELLRRVPKMVRRTLELSSLAIPEALLPKSSIHVFYEEAVRCYVFGLWQAVAVLARGTVEAALREKVKGQPRDKLAALIQTAVRVRVLVGPVVDAASIVKVLGDPAVHGEPVNERDAKKILTCAREVVIALFGGRLGGESRPR